MKLNQLRDFIAVAEGGSLRIAATQLGVTPTALSKSLAALEGTLQVQLLVRHSRGVTLTPFGLAFLSRARRIAAESTKALDELAQLRGEREGSVTLGVSPTPSLVLLPHALAEFRRKFPQLQVSVRGGLYDAHLAAIREGSMDLAVGPVPATLDAAIVHEPLFYNDIVVVARQGHPMGGRRSLAELAGFEWILTSANTQGPGAAILDAFARQGLQPPARLTRCDITWALPALIAGTDCLCALPQPLMQHPLKGLPLQTIALHEPLPRYPVCLVRRADSPLLPAAAHLARLIHRQAHYYGQEHPELLITAAPV